MASRHPAATAAGTACPDTGTFSATAKPSRPSCILRLQGHTLIRMSDYQPHNQTPGNPFEFGITLLLCTAVSATVAVLIAGIAFLVWR